ncbi:hypothetical protein [Clostridium perfringens]|uniref:PRTRC system protein B n=2 Tax=Clostridium perfringens TaxID=1502 RepID=A0A8H9QYE7_CLOPF|nr:hypothetical protein [Clostridium perfringens]MDU7943843.1 hypothetical protein [Streptococcus salivarius]MDU7977686.1 hypothetical protein [Clostridioides difficile]EDT15890.1 hypothetical protein AC3_A0106 [Clostridium perfringens E str. JGS1987]EGS5728037.1 hypothetical protein [Clostridium perfringens]EGT0014435.1 hypothetical protein [Clostridium perfringens]
MVLNIELDTKSNTAKIIKTSQSGKKSSINVGVEDLISSIQISSNKKRRENSFEKIVGPIHQKRNGIELLQSIQINKNAYIHIFKVEKRNVPFFIYDKFFGLCGMPKMIIALKISNDILTDMYATVIKDDFIDMNTKLYEYPFSNVNPYNGHVCLGRNSFKEKFTTIDSMHKCINYFYEIPNTSETFSNLRNSCLFEFRELAELLNNDIFDDNLLVQKENGLTYGDWISKF